MLVLPVVFVSLEISHRDVRAAQSLSLVWCTPWAPRGLCRAHYLGTPIKSSRPWDFGDTFWTTIPRVKNSYRDGGAKTKILSFDLLLCFSNSKAPHENKHYVGAGMHAGEPCNRTLIRLAMRSALLSLDETTYTSGDLFRDSTCLVR